MFSEEFIRGDIAVGEFEFGSGMKAMTAPRQEARPRRKLPRQKYIFPFSKHKEV